MRVALLGATAAGVCLSLFCVGFTFGYWLDAVPGTQISARAGPLALVPAAVFAALGILVLSRSAFSFAYIVAVHFFCVVLGYLWINPFSKLPYDHQVALAAAFISGAVMLAVTYPIQLKLPAISLPGRAAELLPYSFLTVAAATAGTAMLYNFHLVSLGEIYTFRDSIDFPAPLRYANGIVQSALLPFAFAWFMERRRVGLCVVSLLLMAAFYPATLTKFAAFAPLWMLFLVALLRFAKPHSVIVLSILLPLLVGLVGLGIEAALGQPVYRVFGLINFRMFGIPSISMDVYNAFFFNHPPTHFCQIKFVRALVGCPYDPQLGVEISKAYNLGNFNASFLSTEGIASVGVTWAPIPVAVCSAIIALASAMASRLPPRFVLLSSAIMVQQFINVPLSTALLSHGGALLFALWFLTPPRALEK